jgi:hypothetical protein
MSGGLVKQQENKLENLQQEISLEKSRSEKKLPIRNHGGLFKLKLEYENYA